jgi:tetratricopeptide (TPR) repeat protein
MTAVVQEHLGQIAMHEGDYERARAAFAGCLPTFGAFGWRSEVAATLLRLAGASHALGDNEEALSRYTQALALYRELGDQWLPAVALVHSRLAALALERGDRVVANRHVTETLTISQATSLDRVLPFGVTPLPDALEVRAALSAAQDEPVRALRLAAAAAAMRTQFDQPLAASAQVILEEQLTAARAVLTAPQQTEAWAEGRRMTPDETISVALQES